MSREPKFKIGDKVIARHGNLLLLNAEVIDVDLEQSPTFIDYTIRVSDMLSPNPIWRFEEGYLFTKEEVKDKFKEWFGHD